MKKGHTDSTYDSNMEGFLLLISNQIYVLVGDSPQRKISRYGRGSLVLTGRYPTFILRRLKSLEKTIPRLKKVIQTHDVDIDYRGLIYITDRAGTGLHVLEYTDNKK